MFRKDYDKFISIAKHELKYPYFVQTNETDNVCYSCAKIRRTDTMALIPNFTKNYQFNKGIFIDIFPLDFIDDDLLIKCKCCKRELNAVWRTYNECDNSESKLAQLNELKSKLYKLSTSKPTSVVVANIANSLSNQNVTKQVFDFRATFYTQFENLIIPIPVGYNNILTTLYGNWACPVKGLSLHNQIIFDTNRSYLYKEPDIEEVYPNTAYDYEEYYGWASHY